MILLKSKFIDENGQVTVSAIEEPQGKLLDKNISQVFLIHEIPFNWTIPIKGIKCTGRKLLCRQVLWDTLIALLQRS